MSVAWGLRENEVVVPIQDRPHRYAVVDKLLKRNMRVGLFDRRLVLLVGHTRKPRS